MPGAVPLISRTMIIAIVSALLTPLLGSVFWLRGWVSTVDEKLSTVIVNQERQRLDAYPRGEAQLQIQRLDAGLGELKGRLAVIEGRTQTFANDFRRSDPRDRQAEARSMRAQ